MLTLRSPRLPVAALLLGVATSVPAQEYKSATGVKKEIIAQIDDAGRKFVQLAEAIPADKYSWRPATGVRSIGEVYMHIVGANFMIPGIAGVKREKGVTLARDAEKSVTDKAQIIDLLKKSFEYAKLTVMDVPDAEMDASVNLFGSPSTKRGVMILNATHAHEHLGQSIAYARSVGVVPPWSAGSGGDR